jgi:acyl-coenzyme A thioesterase PaaI-like protein
MADLKNLAFHYTKLARELCPIYRFIGIETVSVGNNFYKCFTPLGENNKNHVGIMHAGPIWMTAEYVGALVVMHNCNDDFQPVVGSLDIKFINPAKGGIYAELLFGDDKVRIMKQDLLLHGKHKYEATITLRNENEEKIAEATGTYFVNDFLNKS